MRSVTLHLSDKEYEQLQTLAHASGQTLSDVILEAILEYIHHQKASHEGFRAALERAIQENFELMAELAEL
jgi:predicted transcriptional regulator